MIEFTQEQQMAQRALRQWAEHELEPLVPRMEKGELLPYDAMRKLIRTFGLDEMARAALAETAAANAPPAVRDPGLMAIVSMELARVCPGFTLAFGASLGLAAGAILKRGTPEQRRRFALPLLTGEKIGAWAMTEPGAGSDAFGAMRTTARRDGDGYRLSGAKTFITNAPYADLIVVYAKLLEPAETGKPNAAKDDARHRPILAFVVEKGTPGLSVSAPMEKMGMHSSPTGEVFLDEVGVAPSHVLGADSAKQQAVDVFHGERTGMVPMCLGIIERCLEESLAYAKQRETWGRKIAEYQLVQEKLARMFVHRENVRNLLLRQLEMAAARRPVGMAEASASKLYCARATTEVALEAIQIMGGNGYMREYRVEMLMRDAKLLQIGGGTDEIQIVTIARQLLAE